WHDGAVACARELRARGLAGALDPGDVEAAGVTGLGDAGALRLRRTRRELASLYLVGWGALGDDDLPRLRRLRALREERDNAAGLARDHRRADERAFRAQVDRLAAPLLIEAGAARLDDAVLAVDERALVVCGERRGEGIGGRLAPARTVPERRVLLLRAH